MNTFIKAASLTVIAVVLYLVVGKQNKDIAVLLSIVVCCALLSSAVTYIEPVFLFFEQLQAIGDLDSQWVEILLKSAGIGILSEVVALICTDAGNTALGKAVQILAISVILCMSLPLLTGLIELISEILGET